VCTPAEPAGGGFTWAAGRAGRGREVGLLDLSLELFHQVLSPEGDADSQLSDALGYLLGAAQGYEPQRHRSATGLVHARLRSFAARWPGWTLTLMDLATPTRVHDPSALAAMLASEPSPFASLWDRVLGPVLDRYKPARVLISLAYLSQLAAAIDLRRYLSTRGIEPIVGGSLPNSLARTGGGLESLRGCFPHLEIGDGLSLIQAAPAGQRAGAHLVDALAWPRLLSPQPYLSARPVVPIPLSTGCYWNRCAFCPDRGLELVGVPAEALDSLFCSAPAAIKSARPLVHLLDSALPPALLRRFLPLARSHELSFYGFARPTKRLLEGDLLGEAATAGCAMLQLGVESGSEKLLSRYDKGFSPHQAQRVVRMAAAAGIRTYLYLLLGLPGETESDREATLQMLVDDADAIDFLNLSVFNLPHHSQLAEQHQAYGIELGAFPSDGVIRLYRPFTQRGVDQRAQARRFIQRTLRPHPAVRPIIGRSPRWLRAAHNAMMCVDPREPLQEGRTD